MRKITLWLFALFTCWQMTAQTGIVVVGTSDGTPNTGIGTPSPLQDYYKTQRIQMLYTASELSAAGLAAGNITQIGWVATALNGSGLQENYTVSMKSTVSTVLTTTFESGVTVVYGPTDFTPSTTGNVMFTLTTPFAWDGTSNVLIELCAGLASGIDTQNVSCANSTTAGSQTVYFRSDTSTAPCTQTTGTTTTTKPILVLNGAVASCLPTSNLTVTNITSSGADTSWNNMSGSGAIGYEYAVTTSATPPVSGTATPNVVYIATGLLPQTVYYLHVRSECAASTFSTWVTTTFTTACVPVTTLPWNEGFEGLATVGAAIYPPCWFKENGGWSSQNTNGQYSTANTGTTYIRNEWSATNEYIWTPGFDLVGGTSYDFSSFVQGDNGTGWVVDYFVNSSQISTGATQIGGSYNVPGIGTPYAFQPYAQVTRSFVPVTSGTYYFAVRVNQPSGAPWYVSFDDFELKLSPSCSSPSASASNITDVAADLSWAAVPSADLGYEYVLDNVATDPAGAGTSTVATTYAASGLTQMTAYYFHIRSVCSVGTYSAWSTVSFTTLLTPPVNDNCASATVLTPGAVFATNPLIATNVGATGSIETAPGCASYLGGDVWYSVVVPTSGNLTFENNTNPGGMTDSGAAIYSGTCGALVLIDCDDSASAAPDDHPLMTVTGRTPGEVLYYRVWEFDNNVFGTVQVSAYDASLSAASFDTANFVAYPNPVKDILNLSYKTEISNVRIVNLIGQEVLNTKTNSNDVQVDMFALTAGAYIVKITVEDTVHTIKVIKE